MTKRIFVDKGTKFPLGARLTLKYGGMIYLGTYVGCETVDFSYRDYMILQYDTPNGGHKATNEKGETFRNCWWIEYGTEIIKVKEPFEPACICDIL